MNKPSKAFSLNSAQVSHGTVADVITRMNAKETALLEISTFSFIILIFFVKTIWKKNLFNLAMHLAEYKLKCPQWHQ